MKSKKNEYITCPKCGKEYAPAEIYTPCAFFGKPVVVRSDDGKSIENIIGKDMDFKETYTCDDCNTTFDTIAKISFCTYEHTLEEEYESVVKHGLTLSE